MGRSEEDYNDGELPPSYEEAIKEETGKYSRPPASNNGSSFKPGSSPGGNSYHISTSSSTTTSSSSHITSSHSVDPGSLYTNNESLPFRYPVGFFCDKCKNTGFRKKQKPCMPCWDKFYLNKHSYNPNKKLPYKYPIGFMCGKCNNTGYKLSSGKTCKDCWSAFCRRNYTTNVSSYHGFGTTTDTIMVPSMGNVQGLGGAAPLRVAPGDPRLGGVLCGRCRGSGIVHFLLDEELCPVCGGIGRIINNGMMGARPHGNQMFPAPFQAPPMNYFGPNQFQNQPPPPPRKY